MKLLKPAVNPQVTDRFIYSQGNAVFVDGVLLVIKNGMLYVNGERIESNAFFGDIYEKVDAFVVSAKGSKKKIMLNGNLLVFKDNRLVKLNGVKYRSVYETLESQAF